MGLCKRGTCTRWAEGDFCDRHEGRVKVFRPVYRKLYSTALWARLRGRKLRENPICEYCNERPADQVDHVIPHRGDMKLFKDYSNLKASCQKCHSQKTRKGL